MTRSVAYISNLLRSLGVDPHGVRIVDVGAGQVSYLPVYVVIHLKTRIICAVYLGVFNAHPAVAFGEHASSRTGLFRDPDAGCAALAGAHRHHRIHNPKKHPHYPDNLVRVYRRVDQAHLHPRRARSGSCARASRGTARMRIAHARPPPHLLHPAGRLERSAVVDAHRRHRGRVLLQPSSSARYIHTHLINFVPAHD